MLKSTQLNLCEWNVFGEKKKKGQKFGQIQDLRWKVVSSRVKPNKNDSSQIRDGGLVEIGTMKLIYQTVKNCGC